MIQDEAKGHHFGWFLVFYGLLSRFLFNILEPCYYSYYCEWPRLVRIKGITSPWNYSCFSSFQRIIIGYIFKENFLSFSMRPVRVSHLVRFSRYRPFTAFAWRCPSTFWVMIIMSWSRNFRKSWIRLEDFIFRPCFYCDSESPWRELCDGIYHDPILKKKN